MEMCSCSTWKVPKRANYVRNNQTWSSTDYGNSFVSIKSLAKVVGFSFHVFRNIGLEPPFLKNKRQMSVDFVRKYWFSSCFVLLKCIFVSWCMANKHVFIKELMLGVNCMKAKPNGGNSLLIWPCYFRSIARMFNSLGKISIDHLQQAICANPLVTLKNATKLKH